MCRRVSFCSTLKGKVRSGGYAGDRVLMRGETTSALQTCLNGITLEIFQIGNQVPHEVGLTFSHK
jgi:hypothetical protein